MKKLLVFLGLALALLLVGTGCSAAAAKAESATPTPTPKSASVDTEQPWVGIHVVQLSPQIAKRLGITATEGVLIRTVVPESPAKEAGLQKLDLILKVGNTTITKVAQIPDLVRDAGAGAKLIFTVSRSGQEVSVDVVVGTRPTPAAPVIPNLKGAVPGAALPQILEKLLPELNGLTSIAPKDRFEHFLGSEFSFADKDGKPVTVKMVPGVVKGVSGSTLSVTPNGKTNAVSLDVPQDAIIYNAGKKLSLDQLQAGDKVVVLTVGGQVRAVVVAADLWFPMGSQVPKMIPMPQQPFRGHMGQGFQMGPGYFMPRAQDQPKSVEPKPSPGL